MSKIVHSCTVRQKPSVRAAANAPIARTSYCLCSKHSPWSESICQHAPVPKILIWYLPAAFDNLWWYEYFLRNKPLQNGTKKTYTYWTLCTKHYPYLCSQWTDHKRNGPALLCPINTYHLPFGLFYKQSLFLDTTALWIRIETNQRHIKKDSNHANVWQ
jgi:hypothetical protein